VNEAGRPVAAALLFRDGTGGGLRSGQGLSLAGGDAAPQRLPKWGVSGSGGAGWAADVRLVAGDRQRGPVGRNPLHLLPLQRVPWRRQRTRARRRQAAGERGRCAGARRAGAGRLRRRARSLIWRGPGGPGMGTGRRSSRMIQLHCAGAARLPACRLLEYLYRPLHTIACSLSGPAAACACAHAAGRADAGLPNCAPARQLSLPGQAAACVPGAASPALSFGSEDMPCSPCNVYLCRVYSCRHAKRTPASVSAGPASVLRRGSWRPPLVQCGGAARPRCGLGVSLWRPRARERLLHKACCSAGLLFRGCRHWGLVAQAASPAPRRAKRTWPRELTMTPGSAL